MKAIKGVKGFDKDLKCRGYQYEIGKEYETKEIPVKCTSNGFHFCENPLDVFLYYDPTSKFCEVEGGGDVSRDDLDTKVAVSRIKIGAEISFKKMVDLAVKFIFEKVDWTNAKESNTENSSAATNTGNRSAATNTGDYSAATNTGYRSAATNTGDRSAATNTGNRSAATNTGDSSAATNTGNRSAATNTGDSSAATNTGYRSAATNTGDSSAATNTGYSSAATNTGDSSAATNTGYSSAAITTGCESIAKVEGKFSIACGIGIKNKASGKIGCWLVLAEYKKTKAGWKLTAVKSVKVDGKKILEDTEYEMKNGKIIKSETDQGGVE